MGNLTLYGSQGSDDSRRYREAEFWNKMEQLLDRKLRQVVAEILDNRLKQVNQNIARVSKAAHQTAEQTRPQAPMVIAIIGGLVINLGLQFIRSSDIEHISYPFSLAEQKAFEWAEDWGLTLADYHTGTDRTLPPLTAGQDIRGLSNTQTANLLFDIRARESTHDYKRINQFGYVGAYQFGASALTAIGYLKAGAFNNAESCIKRGTCGAKHLAFIKNPNNWNDGLSYSLYLNSQQIQNNAVIMLANINIKTGFQRRALKAGDTSRIAGFVAAAHLKGAGNAVSWYARGRDSKDGNGTRTSDYARMGEEAINGIN